MRAVGMAGKKWQANKSLPNKAPQATQPADAPSGTGLEDTNGPQLAGLAAKTAAAADDVGLPCS